jgi:hypothetical protein
VIVSGNPGREARYDLALNWLLKDEVYYSSVIKRDET